jgi:multidrug efflux pump subunit AcrB
MAESRNHPQANGSTLVLGVVVGAMAGASGLAWWFLKETERRRQLQSVLQRNTRAELALNSSSTTPFDNPRVNQGAQPPQQDSPFQDRVQQLNQAIDEVRRQLEQLQTHGDRPGR